MKFSRSLVIIGLCLYFSLSVHVSNALSDDRETISGNVTYNGDPVCAMVLANGAYMFTCSGDGSFNFEVPLDGNGQITVFTFCSGLAPYKQVIDSGQGVGMQIAMTSGEQGQGLDITCTLTGIDGGWVNLSGYVTYDGQPVCAMVLANGQYMFTCSGDGSYSLDVPLDGDGNITLFGFCEGLPPYQKIYNESQVIIPTAQPNGLWHGTFTEYGFGTYSIDGIFFGGDIIGISEDAGVIYQGTYFVNGNSLIASVMGFEIDGYKFGTTIITATFIEENQIEGSFTTSYETSGTLSLRFDDDYNKPSSLEIIQGTYFDSTDTIQIDEYGTLTGYNIWGCRCSGVVSILDPKKNIYSVEIDVSSCGWDDGSYDGYVTISDNDALVGTIYNDDYISIWSLEKQR